jgi:hypothetical protein
MWEPPRLTTSWASTACYKQRFFFLPFSRLKILAFTEQIDKYSGQYKKLHCSLEQGVLRGISARTVETLVRVQIMEEYDHCFSGKSYISENFA